MVGSRTFERGVNLRNISIYSIAIDNDQAMVYIYSTSQVFGYKKYYVTCYGINPVPAIKKKMMPKVGF